jgi:hypothetical protein
MHERATEKSVARFALAAQLNAGPFVCTQYAVPLIAQLPLFIRSSRLPGL